MLRKYKEKLFRFVEDDGGASGGGAGESRGGSVFEEEAPSGEGNGNPSTPPPPAAPTFDASAFAKEFGKEIGTVLSTQQQQRPLVKELTTEEAKKLLKVWDPDDTWYAKYDNLETRKTAVAEMRDALVIQSDTLAQHRMNEMREGLLKEFQPALTYMEQHQAAQREERFGKKYTDLSKPELRPLLTAVAQELVKSGKTYQDENLLFEDIAKGVEKVIQVTNPDFKLSAGSSPANNNHTATGIPITTPGAGGGAGGGGGKSAPVKRGLAIFGK